MPYLSQFVQHEWPRLNKSTCQTLCKIELWQRFYSYFIRPAKFNVAPPSTLMLRPDDKPIASPLFIAWLLKVTLSSIITVPVDNCKPVRVDTMVHPFKYSVEVLSVMYN